MIPDPEQYNCTRDAMEHLSELFLHAWLDTQNTELSDKEREDSKIIADAYANAWADMSLRLFPHSSVLPNPVRDENKTLVSVSIKQLRAIVEMAEANKIGPYPINIMCMNGYLTATVISPLYTNGGITLHESASIF
ncbi:MAG: hypothetical protein ACTHKV_14920 [Flavipsychrobacter sp.]